MITLTKQCKYCNRDFDKKSSDSLKYWGKKSFCSGKCAGTYNQPAKKLIGIKRPQHVIDIMKKNMFKLGQTAPMKGRHNHKITGENNNNWKGGITPLNEKIRKSIEYRLWRESVFARDNYTCQECDKRGGNKHAHHIKPFAWFPELRFAIDNGVTLCVPCHRKTESYGRPKQT